MTFEWIKSSMIWYGVKCILGLIQRLTIFQKRNVLMLWVFCLHLSSTSFWTKKYSNQRGCLSGRDVFSETSINLLEKPVLEYNFSSSWIIHLCCCSLSKSQSFPRIGRVLWYPCDPVNCIAALSPREASRSRWGNSPLSFEPRCRNWNLVHLYDIVFYI